MPIARHYEMHATPGKADALAAALKALAGGVTVLPGCLGVELMQDQADADRFIFIETWESVAAHKGAGAQPPKALMAPVMAALARPPVSAYLVCLETA